MNSGTFHPASQTWNYDSRAAALSSQLNLSQLIPNAPSGDGVSIPSSATTAAGNSNGGLNPLQVPSFEFLGHMITNNHLIISCYGSTNNLGQITAQAKMGITVGTINGDLATISLNPEESGFFVVHAEAVSDLHTLGYQGPDSDGKMTLNLKVGGTLVSTTSPQINMVGTNWSATRYLNSVLHTECEVLVPVSGGGIVIEGLNIGLAGTAPSAFICGWAMKIADLW